MNGFSRLGLLLFPLMLVLALCLPLQVSAQSRAKPRAQARAVPMAKSAAPFSLAQPAVDPGQSAKGLYPASAEFAVPALVLHGMRPGPVIAFVFHGFSSEDAFFAEMDVIFGKLNAAQMQGTLLALSLPSRDACKPSCPPADEQVLARLSESLLNDARFLVQIHQHPLPSTLSAHAFIYKAAENARLANYVESMARAALVPNLVAVTALDFPTDAVHHLAPRSIELEHPAIAIETATIEGNNSASAAQLRKGLVNLLHHLKMAPGAVSWQNAVKRVPLPSIRSLILGD